MYSGRAPSGQGAAREHRTRLVEAALPREEHRALVVRVRAARGERRRARVGREAFLRRGRRQHAREGHPRVGVARALLRHTSPEGHQVVPPSVADGQALEAAPRVGAPGLVEHRLRAQRPRPLGVARELEPVRELRGEPRLEGVVAHRLAQHRRRLGEVAPVVDVPGEVEPRRREGRGQAHGAPRGLRRAGDVALPTPHVREDLPCLGVHGEALERLLRPSARVVELALVAREADERRPRLEEIRPRVQERDELPPQLGSGQDDPGGRRVPREAAAVRRLAEQLRVHEAELLALAGVPGSEVDEPVDRPRVVDVEPQRLAEPLPRELETAPRRLQVGQDPVARRGLRCDLAGRHRGRDRLLGAAGAVEEDRQLPAPPCVRRLELDDAAHEGLRSRRIALLDPRQQRPRQADVVGEALHGLLEVRDGRGRSLERGEQPRDAAVRVEGERLPREDLAPRRERAREVAGAASQRGLRPPPGAGARERARRVEVLPRGLEVAGLRLGVREFDEEGPVRGAQAHGLPEDLEPLLREREPGQRIGERHRGQARLRAVRGEPASQPGERLLRPPGGDGGPRVLGGERLVGVLERRREPPELEPAVGRAAPFLELGEQHQGPGVLGPGPVHRGEEPARLGPRPRVGQPVPRELAAERDLLGAPLDRTFEQGDALGPGPGLAEGAQLLAHEARVVGEAGQERLEHAPDLDRVVVEVRQREAGQPAERVVRRGGVERAERSLARRPVEAPEGRLRLVAEVVERGVGQVHGEEPLPVALGREHEATRAREALGAQELLRVGLEGLDAARLLQQQRPARGVVAHHGLEVPRVHVARLDRERQRRVDQADGRLPGDPELPRHEAVLPAPVAFGRRRRPAVADGLDDPVLRHGQARECRERREGRGAARPVRLHDERDREAHAAPSGLGMGEPLGEGPVVRGVDPSGLARGCGVIAPPPVDVAARMGEPGVDGGLAERREGLHAIEEPEQPRRVGGLAQQRVADLGDGGALGRPHRLLEELDGVVAAARRVEQLRQVEERGAIAGAHGERLPRERERLLRAVLQVGGDGGRRHGPRVVRRHRPGSRDQRRGRVPRRGRWRRRAPAAPGGPTGSPTTTCRRPGLRRPAPPARPRWGRDGPGGGGTRTNGPCRSSGARDGPA